MPGFPCFFRLGHFFHDPGRPVPFRRLPGQFIDFLRRIQPQEGPYLAGRQFPCGNQFCRFSGQFQQPQGIGHRRPAFPQLPGRFFLGQPQGLHQLLDAPGLFHGIQVAALHVFHQGHFHHGIFIVVPDHHRHLGESGGFGRPPAPFPGHDFVLPPFLPDDQGLDHPALADAFLQFPEGLRVKGLPGLVGIGLQVLHRHFPYRFSGLFLFHRRSGRRSSLGLPPAEHLVQARHAQTAFLTGHGASPPLPALCRLPPLSREDRTR